MFTTAAFCCVDRYQNFHTNQPEMRWQHKAAIATDSLIGITILAIGLLSLFGTSFGLSLGMTIPPLFQGLIIGGGTAYLGLFLLKGLLMLKESSSCANTYLYKKNNQAYSFY